MAASMLLWSCVVLSGKLRDGAQRIDPQRLSSLQVSYRKFCCNFMQVLVQEIFKTNAADQSDQFWSHTTRLVADLAKRQTIYLNMSR